MPVKFDRCLDASVLGSLDQQALLKSTVLSCLKKLARDDSNGLVGRGALDPHTCPVWVLGDYTPHNGSSDLYYVDVNFIGHYRIFVQNHKQRPWKKAVEVHWIGGDGGMKKGFTTKESPVSNNTVNTGGLAQARTNHSKLLIVNLVTSILSRQDPPSPGPTSDNNNNNDGKSEVFETVPTFPK
jgi:hypothetical protein